MYTKTRRPFHKSVIDHLSTNMYRKLFTQKYFLKNLKLFYDFVEWKKWKLKKNHAFSSALNKLFRSYVLFFCIAALA